MLKKFNPLSKNIRKIHFMFHVIRMFENVLIPQITCDYYSLNFGSKLKKKYVTYKCEHSTGHWPSIT
jgi:hypothetical protein